MSEPGANGTNGQAPALALSGGKGEFSTVRSQRRGEIRMIGRGLAEGWLTPWKINPSLATTLPAMLESMTMADNPRVAVRAAEVITRMQAQNLALAQAVDHAGRLDGGDTTERIEIVYRKPARLETDDE